MTRLCVLFPRLRPIGYQKDVGSIPLTFARDLGWETCLVHTNVEPISADQRGYLEDWVEVHDLGFHNRRQDRFKQLTLWLYKNAHRFDVLLLYQLTLESAAYAEIYKEIRPDGVCFLKLDMDERSAAMLESRSGLKAQLNDRVFQACPIDFFTVETTTLRKKIQPYFDQIRKPLHVFANGFSLDKNLLDRPAPLKEKTILCVARHGMPQKNSPSIVRSFLAIPLGERSNWTLELVGPAETEFQSWLSEFQEPSVVLSGPIYDRDLLYARFEKASIFALSSRWESFGLVLAEAAAARCFIVSTDVGAARDITANAALGELVPIESDSALTAALRRVMQRSDRSIVGTQVREHVIERFSWHHLCRNMQRIIQAYREQITTSLQEQLS